MGLQSESDYLAYCFDEAVYLFGTVVDGELDKAEKSAKGAKQVAGKKMQVLNRMLNEGTADDTGVTKSSPGGFKDPASFVTSRS